MKYGIILFLSIFTLIDLTAQSDSLTVVSDSTKSHKSSGTLKNIFKGKPGKAFAYSLLLPGGGQIYNSRWWKLPIVYSAFGFTFYLIDFNSKQYKRYDNAFRMRIDLGEDNSNDEFKNIYSLSALNIQRKYFDKNLQRSYLAVVAVYLLSGMEAFVDRHFMDFDVSDNLSLHWQPTLLQDNPGLSITMKW